MILFGLFYFAGKLLLVTGCLSFQFLFNHESLFLAGVSLAVLVRQTPSGLFQKPNGTAHLICTHDKSAYRVMLWYQLKPGDTALKLIGYGYNQFRSDSVEEHFKTHFKLEGELSGNTKNGSLIIENVEEQEHTATYFCAAREAQYTSSHMVLTENPFCLCGRSHLILKQSSDCAVNTSLILSFTIGLKDTKKGYNMRL